MRKRKTALDKARDEIAGLESINRNAMAALTMAQGERDRALNDLDAARADTRAIFATTHQQRQHIRRLFNSIFHLNLELERRNGYIERVKERDNGVSVTGPEDVSMGSVDDFRRDLAGARSERKIGSILDGMDPDILDQVLGRDPETDDIADLVRG